MSLYGILKLIGWITLLLLVSFPVQVFTILLDRDHIILSEDTKAYINHLYANPYLKDIMNDPNYQELYLTVVFRHFRDDFVTNGIGNWHRSHWPMLLQALKLMPEYYRVKGNEDKLKLRLFWQTWRHNVPAEPIPHYGQTAIRVPRIMDSVFEGDVPNYRSDTRMVRYAYLVEEMQQFANSLNIATAQSLHLETAKKLCFKAIYWLTVIDQFIGTVQQMRRKDGKAPPRCPFPRTELMLIREPNQVPQQSGPRAPPPTYPLAQPGPSGTNLERRVPSAAAGAPSRGTKRKATHQGGGPSQGGGKRGPGGIMRSMDGTLNAPQVEQSLPQAQQSISGGSCTTLSWISLIMVTIAVSLISFA